MHDQTLVIFNIDDSPSMFWNDFDQAIAGSKQCLDFLRSIHTDLSKVDFQLWQNNIYGVSCSYKGNLVDQVPDTIWESAHHTPSIDRTVGFKRKDLSHLIHCYSRHVDRFYALGRQFGGSINIINKEVLDLLKNEAIPKYEEIYYFFFADGGNMYPNTQINEFKGMMRENKALWTNSTGQQPRLKLIITTNQPKVESLTRIRDEINSVGQELWGIESFCILNEDVQTEELGNTMIKHINQK